MMYNVKSDLVRDVIGLAAGDVSSGNMIDKVIPTDILKVDIIPASSLYTIKQERCDSQAMQDVFVCFFCSLECSDRTTLLHHQHNCAAGQTFAPLKSFAAFTNNNNNNSNSSSCVAQSRRQAMVEGTVGVVEQKRELLKSLGLVWKKDATLKEGGDGKMKEIVCDVIVIEDSSDDEYENEDEEKRRKDIDEEFTIQNYHPKLNTQLVLREANNSSEGLRSQFGSPSMSPRRKAVTRSCTFGIVPNRRSSGKLYKIAITSYLGRRLMNHFESLAARYYSNKNKVETLGACWYESYCNKKIDATKGSPEKRRRNANTANAYQIGCDATFSKGADKHYHTYKLTSKQRTDFKRKCETGLSKHSRVLLKSIRPCKVRLVRLDIRRLVSLAGKISSNAQTLPCVKDDYSRGYGAHSEYSNSSAQSNAAINEMVAKIVQNMEANDDLRMTKRLGIHNSSELESDEDTEEEPSSQSIYTASTNSAGRTVIHKRCPDQNIPNRSSSDIQSLDMLTSVADALLSTENTVQKGNSVSLAIDHATSISPSKTHTKVSSITDETSNSTTSVISHELLAPETDLPLPNVAKYNSCVSETIDSVSCAAIISLSSSDSDSDGDNVIPVKPGQKRKHCDTSQDVTDSKLGVKSTDVQPSKALRLSDANLPGLTFRCNLCSKLIFCPAATTASSIRLHYSSMHGVTNVDILEQKQPDGRVVLSLVELSSSASNSTENQVRQAGMPSRSSPEVNDSTALMHSVITVASQNTDSKRKVSNTSSVSDIISNETMQGSAISNGHTCFNTFNASAVMNKNAVPMVSVSQCSSIFSTALSNSAVISAFPAAPVISHHSSVSPVSKDNDVIVITDITADDSASDSSTMQGVQGLLMQFVVPVSPVVLVANSCIKASSQTVQSPKNLLNGSGDQSIMTTDCVTSLSSLPVTSVTTCPAVTVQEEQLRNSPLITKTKRLVWHQYTPTVFSLASNSMNVSMTNGTQEAVPQISENITSAVSEGRSPASQQLETCRIALSSTSVSTEIVLISDSSDAIVSKDCVPSLSSGTSGIAIHSSQEKEDVVLISEELLSSKSVRIETNNCSGNTVNRKTSRKNISNPEPHNQQGDNQVRLRSPSGNHENAVHAPARVSEITDCSASVIPSANTSNFCSSSNLLDDRYVSHLLSSIPSSKDIVSGAAVTTSCAHGCVEQSQEIAVLSGAAIIINDDTDSQRAMFIESELDDDIIFVTVDTPRTSPSTTAINRNSISCQSVPLSRISALPSVALHTSKISRTVELPLTTTSEMKVLLPTAAVNTRSTSFVPVTSSPNSNCRVNVFSSQALPQNFTEKSVNFLFVDSASVTPVAVDLISHATGLQNIANSGKKHVRFADQDDSVNWSSIKTGIHSACNAVTHAVDNPGFSRVSHIQTGHNTESMPTPVCDLTILEKNCVDSANSSAAVQPHQRTLPAPGRILERQTSSSLVNSKHKSPTMAGSITSMSPHTTFASGRIDMLPTEPVELTPAVLQTINNVAQSLRHPQRFRSPNQPLQQHFRTTPVQFYVGKPSTSLQEHPAVVRRVRRPRVSDLTTVYSTFQPQQLVQHQRLQKHTEIKGFSSAANTVAPQQLSCKLPDLFIWTPGDKLVNINKNIPLTHTEALGRPRTNSNAPFIVTTGLSACSTDLCSTGSLTAPHSVQACCNSPGAMTESMMGCYVADAQAVSLHPNGCSNGPSANTIHIKLSSRSTSTAAQNLQRFSGDSQHGNKVRRVAPQHPAPMISTPFTQHSGSGIILPKTAQCSQNTVFHPTLAPNYRFGQNPAMGEQLIRITDNMGIAVSSGTEISSTSGSTISSQPSRTPRNRPQIYTEVICLD